MIIQKIQVLRDKCLETGGGVSVWDANTNAEDADGAAHDNADAVVDVHYVEDATAADGDAHAYSIHESRDDAYAADVDVDASCWADADAELESPP